MNHQVYGIDYTVFYPKDIGDFVSYYDDQMEHMEHEVFYGVIVDIDADMEAVCIQSARLQHPRTIPFHDVEFLSDKESPEILSELIKWRNENQTVLDANIAKYGSPSEMAQTIPLDMAATCITSHSGPKKKWFTHIPAALNLVREFYRPSHRWMKGLRNDCLHPNLLKHLARDDVGQVRFTAEWGPHIKRIAPGIWRFPLLSPLYCQWLIQIANEKNYWQKERGDQYAAMETRLGMISPWLDATHTKIIAGHFINQICTAIFTNWMVKQCEEPFIIKYTDAIDSIHTHCDGDSRLTMLVHLEGGGGTEFPSLSTKVDDMYQGEALLFCGGAPLFEHRSIPCKDRYVLVYWMN
jgi:hypothetical protein